MFIVILFFVLVLIASCTLPDFSISSLTQIATNAFASNEPAAPPSERKPMRMPRARKCKTAVLPAESSED